MVKRMGKILLLGFPESPVQADFSLLGKDNKSIYTVRGEGWANCGRAVSLLASGKVNLKRLVTHTFPIGQISEAFRTFQERIGGAIKVIVSEASVTIRRTGKTPISVFHGTALLRTSIGTLAW
jgi:L-iditol 2-dehydrogenase